MVKKLVQPTRVSEDGRHGAGRPLALCRVGPAAGNGQTRMTTRHERFSIMKTPFDKSAGSRRANCSITNSCPLGRAVWLTVLCWVVWVVGPRTFAQMPPGLDLQLYAGLTITGAVGTVYSIEYVTDLAQTNTPSAWRCLEFLQLSASSYLWADKSAPATGKRFYRAVQIEAPTNLVFIPPGTFRMGSPTNELYRDNSEGPQTDVTISRGYWMGKYEVTQGDYGAVMGSNPSYFSGCDRKWRSVEGELSE